VTTRLRDGARLAVGTFTAFPVRPPTVMDRDTARTAMLLAPVVGAGLGMLAAGVHFLARWVEGGGRTHLAAAVLTVAALAAATRALHLDGVADTADGLGVRRGREAALAAMREPGVGAFGVVTLVLLLLTQVAALDRVTSAGGATGALLIAMSAGRAAAAVACVRGVPAARSDGLGAAVAGSLPLPAALAVVAVPLGLAVGWGVVDTNGRPVQAVIAVAVGGVVAAGLLAHCVRRLGGITGDVLGALVELTTTVVLLGLAASPKVAEQLVAAVPS
jgi:adenosylcobinamide-GDP ribazoletransferase